ncbi:MAG: CdaR family protein [Thermoanaerobacteraceae bacterium]|nr:CdaR family protein [Thermoanaerobacteraceae bacterium]
MLTKDITIKIFSVILAFLLWLYVMGDENPEIPYEMANIPVKIVNINTLEKKGLTIVDEKNYYVTLRLRGRRNDILKLKSTDITAQADLSRITSKGINVIPIDINGLPNNIALVSISPSEIKVNVDYIAQIEMPVNIEISGNIAEGYAMMPAVSKPEKVLISGPKSKINLVKNIVAQVNVSNKNKDMNISVPVIALDKDNKEVKGINIDPKFVNINIEVNKTVKVPVNAKIIGKVQDGYDIASVNVMPEYVYITGSDSILDKIKSINTKQIDITGLNHKITQDIPYDLPEGAKLVKNDSTAKVFIDIQKVITKDIVINNIQVKDSQNRNPQLSNQTVTVTVSGVESVVNSAVPDNFNAYVDVSNFGSGKQNVNINVTTNLNLKIIKINPDTANVTIP